MPIEVELPGGTVAEFPDDMPEDKISEAIKGHLNPTDEQGFTQKQRRSQFNTEAKYGEDLPVPGMVGQVRAGLETPAVKTIPLVEPMLAIGQSPYASKPVQILSGAAQGVVDLAKGFTSPIGIATLGLGGPLSKAPKAIQSAISAAFAVQGGVQALDAADPLVKAVKDEDWGAASRLATDIVGSGAQAVLGSAHAKGVFEPVPNIPNRNIEFGREPMEQPPLPEIGKARAAGLTESAKAAEENIQQSAKGGESDAGENKEAATVHGD